jgi:hypothetical protein
MFLKLGALVFVMSIPVPLILPIIPLFLEFGSISNSGAAWQAAQPNPPPVRFPVASKTGGARNRFFP